MIGQAQDRASNSQFGEIAEDAAWVTGDYGRGVILVLNNLTVQRAGVNPSIK